ncbi:MAG: 2Fe-2S iron-sulfur cluster-binding protein [Woeseiaceae bacterium]
MNQVNRLPSPQGLLVDRSETVRFEFEGQSVEGFVGDTIASALAANDRWLLSRSFKYHRPRGILTMAGQDANTLVQLPGDPNCLADRTPISDGLKVTGQNYSGSLRRDRNSLIGHLARFLPVGFYYHAFFRPRGIWNWWSAYFRKKAGLGVVDQSIVGAGFDKQYRFCDVAVIGGGPVGMSAAIKAATSGGEVLLIEEHAVLGGSLNYARSSSDASAERLRRDRLISDVEATPNITVMTNATANGWYADNWISVLCGKRLHKLRAHKVVLCSGLLEQHALFHNNDLPGVMMGSAAQRLIKLYGVRPGKRAVVLAGNDDAYGVAMDLLDAGVEVAAVVDCRAEISPDERVGAVSRQGVAIMTGHAVYEARRDNQHLASVEVRRIVGPGECTDHGERIGCDLLCLSVGFMPAYQLACQAGAELSYDEQSASFSITRLPENLDVGEAWDVQNFPWPIFAHPKGKEFVDFDEDLQIADIINATLAGYKHVQLVKRYSTCGMGPSQGRQSALPTARLVAKATGTTIAETGVTTARPPFAPETLGHCAGRSFYPALRTSMHHRHIEAGAQMLQAGSWYRPAYYGDEPEQAIREEVLQVRQSVGLIDVSTLGGIDVRGPDAAEFLNRVYTFAYMKQAPGTVRYALMTNEAGVVIDDGVVCRLSARHFYVTATTGGVEAVFRKMLQWNAHWRLDVSLLNVTSAYAGVNIVGPASRAVIEPLCEGFDVDGAAFPYLGVRRGKVADIPATLLRVGFVGELGYEIHVPQHSGEALWDALMDAGKSAGIRPVGIEAQRLLRLEKGHVIVGQDTDAMSNPMELQMQWAIARKKGYFVGGRSLEVLERRPLQRKLVGFCANGTGTVPKESHLVIDGENIAGRVTSCAWSPSLEKTIGLAYVAPDSAVPGSAISIAVDGGLTVSAEVVPLPFYDADGLRQAM